MWPCPKMMKKLPINTIILDFRLPVHPKTKTMLQQHPCRALHPEPLEVLQMPSIWASYGVHCSGEDHESDTCSTPTHLPAVIATVNISLIPRTARNGSTRKRSRELKPSTDLFSWCQEGRGIQDDLGQTCNCRKAKSKSITRSSSMQTDITWPYFEILPSTTKSTKIKSSSSESSTPTSKSSQNYQLAETRLLCPRM